MKRFALIVAALYLLLLAGLTVPVVWISFAGKSNLSNPRDILDVYFQWQYWILPAVLATAQLVLLSVPVRVASRRPVTRASLLAPIFTSALMMAGLATGAACSIWEFIARENAGGGGNWLLIPGILTWGIWSLVFYRVSLPEKASDMISRQCRLLLKGSILELLIAVPTHIVARYRDYCCAGFLTFVGLTMGIAVMLFSFGPAVFFLYVERWKRLHPEIASRTNNPTFPPK